MSERDPSASAGSIKRTASPRCRVTSGSETSIRRLSTLSGGEQRRVALARALIARADLTILDEPTNHLDAETVEWLEQYLIDEHAGAILLITHDRYLLDRVAERTLEVADGEVFSYDGGYELYLEQKAERAGARRAPSRTGRTSCGASSSGCAVSPRRAPPSKRRASTAPKRRSPFRGRRPSRPHSFELDVARSGKTILETRALAVEINGRTLVKNLRNVPDRGRAHRRGGCRTGSARPRC